MHYESITKVALDLGFLVTDNRNAQVAMCSLLSQDVSENPVSIFKKVKPGVYDISSYTLLGHEILKYNDLYSRIYSLMEDLSLHSPLIICRRAFYITKKAYGYADEDNFVLIYNGHNKIRVKMDSIEKMNKCFDPACLGVDRPDDLRKTINLDRDFLLSIKNFGLSIGIDTIEKTFDIGITFFECCHSYHSNGYVEILGSSGPKRLQLSFGRR